MANIFQKACKTLNFMKIIVHKIPPGGGGGSETISIQRPLKIAVFYFYSENHDDIYMSSDLGKD